jgi:hypothetical protein
MGEWRYNSTILELVINLRSVVSFTSLPLYARGKVPGNNCIGGWVDPRTGYEAMEKIAKHSREH